MPDSKTIDKAKQKAIDELRAKLGQMNNAAIDIVFKAIENNFDFTGGKVQQTAAFIKQLNRMTLEILDLAQTTPKFTGPIGSFVKRLDSISDAITDFQKQTNNITVPDFVTAKKIVIDEVLDQMTNNGLNQGFVQPLRDLIHQAFTSGLSLSDAKDQIKEYIKGGRDITGKLGRYIEQTAQQSVDAYSGAINQKLLEQFSFDGLLITGSLIDNSSPQCRFAINELGGLITRENWPQVKAKATKKFPLIEGTTFDNLPITKLHWGCRHNFYPKKIIKKAA